MSRRLSKRKLLLSVVLAFVFTLTFTTISTVITDNNTVSANSATYSVGSKGSGVKTLQSKLKSKGYNLAVDGIFGQDTKRQVMKFQRDNGLSVDGIAGKQTHAALNKSVKKPKQNINVIKNTKEYTVTANTNLNIRSGNSTKYGIVGKIARGKTIKATGKTSNGWIQFNHNGKIAYASGKYLVTKSKNVVDKMTKLGNNKQVILVTTKGMNDYKGKVRTFEKDSNGKWNQKLSATAYVGKNGLAHDKREGDLRSPTGKYSIGHAFGYKGNPGTKLPFKASTSNDVWVDDSNSKFYNTWQKKTNKNKDWNSAEEMTHELYKYGFTINYNTAQTPNKGSAIFMHVAREGTGYTTGCTATSQGNLLKIMNWIDPAKNPVIIQDVESNLGKY